MPPRELPPQDGGMVGNEIGATAAALLLYCLMWIDGVESCPLRLLEQCVMGPDSIR